VLQLGVLGCRRAHERAVIDGWAGDVIGEIDFTAFGSVFGFVGCRIGETNGLFISDQLCNAQLRE